MKAAALGRAGWGIADQVLASATNFMLLVVVARSVSPERFGLFAVLMAAYVLVAFVGRGATSEPLTTRYSAASDEVWRTAVRGSLAATVALGLAIGAVTLVLAALLPTGLAAPVAAFAAVVPGVLLQDHVRFAFFSRGRARAAFLDDLLWAVAQLGGVALALRLNDNGSVAELVLVWGLSGGLAAVAGAAALGVAPDLERVRWWFREHRDLWRFFAAENALLQVTNLLVLAVVGLVAGLGATGSLRAATAIFGPVVVLTLGAMAVGVPTLARRGGGAPVRRLATLTGLGLAAVTAAWGLVAHAVPEPVGALLLGDSWASARPILLVCTIDFIAQAFVVGPFMGLRALGSGKRSLGVRTGFAAVRLVAACAGALLGGALGAAIGFAIMAPFQMVVWWLALRAETSRLPEEIRK